MRGLGVVVGNRNITEPGIRKITSWHEKNPLAPPPSQAGNNNRSLRMSGRSESLERPEVFAREIHPTWIGQGLCSWTFSWELCITREYKFSCVTGAQSQSVHTCQNCCKKVFQPNHIATTCFVLNYYTCSCVGHPLKLIFRNEQIVALAQGNLYLFSQIRSCAAP